MRLFYWSDPQTNAALNIIIYSHVKKSGAWFMEISVWRTALKLYMYQAKERERTLY
jgi:hypothetical protein